MSFKDLIPLIEKRLDVAIKDQDRPFQMQLGAITGDCNKRGMLHSGGYIQLTATEHCKQFRTHASLALKCLIEVLEAARQVLTSENFEDIKKYLYQVLDRQHAILARKSGTVGTVIAQMSLSDIWDRSLKECLGDEKRRLDGQLDLMLLASKTRTDSNSNVNTATSQTLNFYGHVTNVQTGASSQIFQTFTTQDTATLNALLDEVRSALAKLSDGDEAKAELLQAVDVVKEELSKDNKNKITITGTLGAIGAGIGRISQLMEVYDKFKGIVSAYGIFLP
jgi:hypothetical protein